MLADSPGKETLPLLENRLMVERRDANKQELEDINRRLERLETRGSDTAIASLQKFEMVSNNLNLLQGKVDDIVKKLDSLFENGCMLGKIQEEKIMELNKKVEYTFQISQEAKNETLQFRVVQSIVIALSTALMVGLVNYFFFHFSKT